MTATQQGQEIMMAWVRQPILTVRTKWLIHKKVVTVDCVLWVVVTHDDSQLHHKLLKEIKTNVHRTTYGYQLFCYALESWPDKHVFELKVGDYYLHYICCSYSYDSQHRLVIQACLTTKCS